MFEEGDLFSFNTPRYTDRITFAESSRKLVEGVVVVYRRPNGDLAFADLFGDNSSTRWAFEMKNFHKLTFIGNTSEIKNTDFLK